MLNVGIIGNTEVLEPHVKRIQKNKIINIIGKASVGTSTQLNGFHFSIPEFNKVELIERADVFLIDNSSLLPFDILCDIVKKSKHIFITEYLNITTVECAELIKLATESGSIVQVFNPIYYTPAIQWLNKNKTMPIFLDISKYTTEVTFRETLFPLLLMLAEITGISSKKVGTTAFGSTQNETNFANIRLEYGDSSVVNINFGNQLLVDKFKIKAFSKGKTISLDFNEEIFLSDKTVINFSDEFTVNEFDKFIESIQNQSPKINSLDDYHSAIQLVETIEKKIFQIIGGDF